MSIEMKEASSYNLAKSTSWKVLDVDRSRNDLRSSLGKKRIGSYCYNLTDCIGSGYSSKVFRGWKHEKKQIKYAIKVIKLEFMSKGNYHLLQNQIQILKQLNHPHIIKLHDVFYTQNNCYIITDYCQGGTLQNYIDSPNNIQWKIIFNQLLQACQYLSNKLIIHRDLKPANIFRKGDNWILGDFGFARYLPYKNAQINQQFLVGSPLYMPPQTLSKNIYSLKTDSFALGVLLFYLITKSFPWTGNNKKQLLSSYSSIKYPSQKISHIVYSIQKYIAGLCDIEMNKRMYIQQFNNLKVIDSNYSQTTQCSLPLQKQQGGEEDDEYSTNPQKKYNNQSACFDFIRFVDRTINLNIIDRMKICKFIVSIDRNIKDLVEMNNISTSLRKLLKLLFICFGWHQKDSFINYMKQFQCVESSPYQNISQLCIFKTLIIKSANDLEESIIRRCLVLRIKLIQLAQFIQNIVQGNSTRIKQLVFQIILHTDFSCVVIPTNQLYKYS